MTARFPGSQFNPASLGHPRPPAAATDGRIAPKPLRLTGIGSNLREAREAREISHAEAEHDTHIPRHHLQALEDERFDAFPAAVYVRGFLRIYSQYLGLDGNALLALLPADRPVEEEGLPPVSRLGRPRGPREAARARRDPAARDAPRLTDQPAQPEVPETRSDEHDPMRSQRSALTRPVGASSHRVDPLGRLGWPERPGQTAAAQQPDTMPWPDEAYNRPGPRPAPTASRRRPMATHSRIHRRTQFRLPEDARPLVESMPLGKAFLVGLALVAFWVIMLIIGGGDQNPSVFAAGGTAATTQASAPASTIVVQPPGTAESRGHMPDVHGQNLAAALSSLSNQGITPSIISPAGVDTSQSQIIAQSPPAGSNLKSDTPVLLVVGSGS